MIPEPNIPLSVVVRNTLHACVDDTDITQSQFEELFCLCMENEANRKMKRPAVNTGELLEQFCSNRSIKRKRR